MSLGSHFRRFWTAAVLVNVGDGIRLAAFPLLAASLTDSAAWVSVVTAASTVPWLVAGLAAGSLADRRGARGLMVTADAVRLAVLVGLAVLVAVGAAGVAIVAVAALLLGVAETLRDTAAQTAIPRLVPAALLERANGRLVAGEVAGNEFVGPLLGGLLFGVGAAVPFVANSAATVLAVAAVLSIPATVLNLRAPSSPEARPEVGAGVRAALSWLVRQRALRMLVVAGLGVAVADSAWFAVFVLYTEQTLELGPVGFGALLAVGAVGGLAGAVLADKAVAGRRHRLVLAVAMLLAAATPVVLLVLPTVPGAVVVVVTTSAAFGLFNVVAVSLRQRLVPGDLLGRVTATWRTVVYGGGALGALAGGALATQWGLDAPFVLCGVVGLVAAAAWLLGSRGLPQVSGGAA
ncbi:MFS transporter [Saccharomonospora azurea]|uniref:Arabinose efflux permease family protein n=1 Tax=Saccharomonospora azurea NA-128 TaxID=882081 RepID=H8GD51_9PSEU|nr:MFS transporter [Saccharomonospora azurea]EHY88840.1 arabinose efflux permease family protein [Saccharomonospora azurea NA-128]